MFKLYDFLESGNGYKARLLLTQLGIPFERIELDILKGESRTPAFLKKNPNARIPVLELDDGTCLAESNAIIWYLAGSCTSLSILSATSNLIRWQWVFLDESNKKYKSNGYHYH